MRSVTLRLSTRRLLLCAIWRSSRPAITRWCAIGRAASIAAAGIDCSPDRPGIAARTSDSASACSRTLGTSTSAYVAASLLPTSLRRRARSAFSSSRSRLARTSLRNVSAEPSAMPKLRMKSASTSGMCEACTSPMRSSTFASLVALQGTIERGQRGVAADHGGRAFAAFRRMPKITGLREVIDDHHVTVRRGALDLLEGAALRAQCLDHPVDIGLADLGPGAIDLQDADVDGRQFRHHLESRRVGDLAVLRLAIGIDVGIRDRLQVLLLHGFAEGAADQVGQGFTAHLIAITLLDDLHRHLAGTEALQAHVAAEFRDALAHP